MVPEPANQPPASGSSTVSRVMIVIGAVMILSYTVYRLRYAAQNLPFDPGTPFPMTEVTATSRQELQALLREAFLSRHSVRVANVDAKTPLPREHLAWPLHGLERERATRMIEQMLAGHRDVPPEQRTVQGNCQHATLLAARSLIEQDRVFVVDGGVEVLDALAPIQDWSLLLFSKNGRDRVLYAPIDSAEFDYVREAQTAEPASFTPR